MAIFRKVELLAQANVSRMSRVKLMMMKRLCGGELDTLRVTYVSV